MGWKLHAHYPSVFSCVWKSQPVFLPMTKCYSSRANIFERSKGTYACFCVVWTHSVQVAKVLVSVLIVLYFFVRLSSAPSYPIYLLNINEIVLWVFSIWSSVILCHLIRSRDMKEDQILLKSKIKNCIVICLHCQKGYNFFSGTRSTWILFVVWIKKCLHSHNFRFWLQFHLQLSPCNKTGCLKLGNDAPLNPASYVFFL